MEIDGELYEAILEGPGLRQDQVIHERWAKLTGGGTLDGRVADAEKAFANLREELRAKFGVPEVVVERAMGDAERAAVARIKRDMVLNQEAAPSTLRNWRGAELPRPEPGGD